MSERELQKLLDKMPVTWKCVECGKEVINSPSHEMPYAVKTEYRNGRRRIVGDICEACHSSHPAG